MNISGFFQFIFGFILGVLLLVTGSVGAAYYFFNRLAAAPPKPVFSETVPAAPHAEEPTPLNNADVAKSPTESNTETKAEEKKETEAEKIPEGAYKAKVSWSSGLSLRAEPDLNADRVGGVDYNTEVLVIEESDDKVWQKIRLSDGQEAWVKAGNVEKVD
jgi:hypothetical protein